MNSNEQVAHYPTCVVPSLWHFLAPRNAQCGGAVAHTCATMCHAVVQPPQSNVDIHTAPPKKTAVWLYLPSVTCTCHAASATGGPLDVAARLLAALRACGLKRENRRMVSWWSPLASAPVSAPCPRSPNPSALLPGCCLGAALVPWCAGGTWLVPWTQRPRHDHRVPLIFSYGATRGQASAWPRHRLVSACT